MSRWLKLLLVVTAVLALLTVGASAKIIVIDNMDDVTPRSGSGTVSLETENIKKVGAIKCGDSDFCRSSAILRRSIFLPMKMTVL